MPTDRKQRDPAVLASALMMVGGVIAGAGFGAVFGETYDGAFGGAGLGLLSLGWWLVLTDRRS